MLDSIYHMIKLDLQFLTMGVCDSHDAMVLQRKGCILWNVLMEYESVRAWEMVLSVLSNTEKGKICSSLRKPSHLKICNSASGHMYVSSNSSTFFFFLRRLDLQIYFVSLFSFLIIWVYSMKLPFSMGLADWKIEYSFLSL
jgi:hypothetical protein